MTLFSSSNVRLVAYEALFLVSCGHVTRAYIHFSRPTHHSLWFVCQHSRLIMEPVEPFLHDLASDARARLWLLTKHPPGLSQIGLQPTNSCMVIFPPSVVTLRSRFAIGRNTSLMLTQACGSS